MAYVLIYMAYFLIFLDVLVDFTRIPDKNTRHAGRKSMKYKMSKVRAKRSQSTHAPPRQSKSKTKPALLRQPKSQTACITTISSALASLGSSKRPAR